MADRRDCYGSECLTNPLRAAEQKEIASCCIFWRVGCDVSLSAFAPAPSRTSALRNAVQGAAAAETDAEAM
jgi:hypothetical protein